MNGTPKTKVNITGGVADADIQALAFLGGYSGTLSAPEMQIARAVLHGAVQKLQPNGPIDAEALAHSLLGSLADSLHEAFADERQKLFDGQRAPQQEKK